MPATRSQIRHYREMAEQARAENAAGVDRSIPPAPVPEMPTGPERVQVAGGWAIVRDGKVVDVERYADAWGDGK